MVAVFAVDFVTVHSSAAVLLPVEAGFSLRVTPVINIHLMDYNCCEYATTWLLLLVEGPRCDVGSNSNSQQSIFVVAGSRRL